ncbi:dehydrogenase, putative [Ixodes scapularis]|uniref:Dehydrogenase, putative n=1 Tax=Ixodes scapularis TaxID=6945 RepID=B7PF86_IXOSC|nr:dehydrogenase, putative [Ixodes scapularis]|eukprot:XP_002433858.1 dehydrogenase, putative [Ixodes scapularis]
MEDPGVARDRLLGLIVLTSLSFILMAVTPPLRFLLSLVSNLIFSLIVGFNIAELIDRKYRREVRIKDPTVFITGCDSGLGLHTARRLHEHGFEVYAGCLDPNSDGGAILKDLKVTVVPIDYLDEESIVQAYKTVTTHLGEKALWGIVANAGVTNYGEIEWMSHDELRWIINVNLSGTLRFVKEGIPHLRRSRGRLVIMSGVQGKHSLIFVHWAVAASTAAAGICSLADGVRRELFKWRVNVSTVEPMLYKTRITDPENVKIGVNEVINRMSPILKEEYGQVYLDTFKTIIPKRMQKYMHVNLNDVSKACTGKLTVYALTDPVPKARYRCGSSDLALCTLLELLPMELVDSFFVSLFQPRSKFKTTLSTITAPMSIKDTL